MGYLYLRGNRKIRKRQSNAETVEINLMYRKQTHAFTFHPNQKKCNPNKKKILCYHTSQSGNP